MPWLRLTVKETDFGKRGCATKEHARRMYAYEHAIWRTLRAMPRVRDKLLQVAVLPLGAQVWLQGPVGGPDDCLTLWHGPRVLKWFNRRVDTCKSLKCAHYVWKPGGRVHGLLCLYVALRRKERRRKTP